jgi:hypothetical protein
MFGTSPRLDLAPNDHPLPLTKLRVNTHYLRGRDAGHFGRWLGVRSDVIYTIMSDEQRRQRPQGPRPFRLQLAEIMSFDPRLDLQLGKRSQRVKLNRLAATFHRRVV